jgi:flagellar motor switch protein FliN/FliY
MNVGSSKPLDKDLSRPLGEDKRAGLASPMTFDELSDTSTGTEPGNDIGMVLDLPVQVMVELGRTKVTIAELLAFRVGAVIELNVNAGDPLDLVVNGCLIAQGEVVIVNNRYGIRLTDIVSPSERLRKTHR